MLELYVYVYFAWVSRAILMAVCGNRIQGDVCSQTASGSQLPIYYSHTWIHTRGHTHTNTHITVFPHVLLFKTLFNVCFWAVQSSGFVSFLVFYFLIREHKCKFVHLFVYLCIFAYLLGNQSHPWRQITALFAFVNKPKMSIDQIEEGRLKSSEIKRQITTKKSTVW